MTLTWFAVNNTATAADAEHLAPFGIDLRPPSSEPVTMYRDPASGRYVAQIGAVQVIRDGPVRVQPRLDCSPAGLDMLVSTALECVERDLHKRDAWQYRRATSQRRGYWHTTIVISNRDGSPLFANRAAELATAPARCIDLTNGSADAIHGEAVTR